MQRGPGTGTNRSKRRGSPYGNALDGTVYCTTRSSSGARTEEHYIRSENKKASSPLRLCYCPALACCLTKIYKSFFPSKPEPLNTVHCCELLQFLVNRSRIEERKFEDSFFYGHYRGSPSGANDSDSVLTPDWAVWLV